MRVPFRAIVFLLLLGMIANIGIAWSLAYGWNMHDLEGSPFRFGNVGSKSWVIFEPDARGVKVALAIWNTRANFREYFDTGDLVVDDIPDWSRALHDPIVTAPPGTKPMLLDYAHGWPCVSLASGVEGGWNGDDIEQAVDTACIKLGTAPTSMWDRRALPLRPLAPGFLINTVFYAAFLSMLVIPFGYFRNWNRIRRNLCPACAYPVGTSNVCTECGKPVKRRSAAAPAAAP